MTTRASAQSREDGRAKVLGCLLHLGPLSRADLARCAGLAPSTVTGVVAALQDEEIVVETTRPATSAGPGRPGTLLTIRAGAGFVVGLDFGKQHLTVAVADLAHDTVAERRIDLSVDLPAREQVARAAVLVRDCLASVDAGIEEVVSIAAGIPGPVQRTGHLGESTILPGWVDLAAADVLAATFGRPVRVDNDANLGALAEWTWGRARGVDQVLYVKLSTGIGAGLIVDGSPYHGAGGTAGEIGHLTVEPGGALCRCGRRGCLEAVTGSGVVIERVRASGIEVDSVADVLRLASEGEPAATAALAHCGESVGSALGGICNVLNPQLVVLGGELAAAGDDIVGPLSASLARSTLRSAHDDLTLCIGELGERAEMLGAIALALRSASVVDVLG